MTYSTDLTIDKKGLAQLILGLTFGELKAIATELHAMCEAPERRVAVSAQDFIDLLHDWAEAQ